MSNKQACAKMVYKVTQQDLPLTCPMKGMDIWEAHPRVSLSIEKTGKAKCEYCGADYLLMDFSTELTEDATTNVEYAD